MPLVSKLPPRNMEDDSNEEDYHDTVQVQHKEDVSRVGIDNERESGGYVNSDEKDDCSDSDMEGSIIHRPRPKKPSKPPPTLPQRSERRASRILDNVMLELKSLDGTASKQMERTSALLEEDPLEQYLSSEEEASLSDDYEDSILGSETEDVAEDEQKTHSRPSSRKSQEDTARIVSFVMVGKPQIVDIYINTSPTSIHQRHSLAFETFAAAVDEATQSKTLANRPKPLKLFPNSSRRVSVSSTASSATAPNTESTANTTPQQAPSHSTSYIAPSPQRSLTSNSKVPSKSINGPLPPRKSSRIVSNLSSLVTSTKSALQQSNQSPASLTTSSALPTQLSNTETHSFLNMDPFEAAHAESPTRLSSSSSRHSYHQGTLSATPKTPTSTSTAPWKIPHGLSRTLSKARRPSMPKINLSYTNGTVIPSSERNSSRASLAPSNSSSHHFEEEIEPQQRLARRSMTLPGFMTEQQTQLANANKSRYEEIMRNTNRAPTTPQTPKLLKKGAMSAMMGLGWKKNSNATTKT